MQPNERLCMTNRWGGSVNDGKCIAEGKFSEVVDVFDRYLNITPVEMRYVEGVGGLYRVYINADAVE